MSRPWPIRRRCLSDTDIYCTAKPPEQFGSEELRLYCESRNIAATQSKPDAATAESAAAPAAAQHESFMRQTNVNTATSNSSESPAVSLSATCCLEDSTTLLLENLPSMYTGNLLVQTLDALGLRGLYDFTFLPMDLRTRTSNGHAIVNFRAHEAARSAKELLHSSAHWIVSSTQVCTAKWNPHYQGLDALIERYRNSPVMHPAVPDVYKPAVFDSTGECAPFPEPTKVIRMPRLRRKAGGKRRSADSSGAAPGSAASDATTCTRSAEDSANTMDAWFVDLVASRAVMGCGASAA